MAKRWQRVTLVHAPIIAALWLLDAQFANRYHNMKMMFGILVTTHCLLFCAYKIMVIAMTPPIKNSSQERILQVDSPIVIVTE